MILFVSLALAGDYDHVVMAALREKAIYREAYAAMMLKAVYVDEQVRSAQATKLTEMGGSAPAADSATTIVFGAYSHWRKEMTVGADNTSAWVARAWRGETACTLLDVSQNKAPTSWDRALYPFLSNWDTLWTARFDSNCGAGELRFALQGPRGKVEVHW
jgi:hypothetical protein